ncbi:MAG: BTAD domain-containing putative transcriptional regulator [Candidatus Zixiibacteriota bacterium]
MFQIQDDLLFLLEELGESPGWLVLDNWEYVDGYASQRHFIERIIASGDVSPTIIIASRKPLTLKTALLRSQARAVRLSEKDLAFNIYECEALMKAGTKAPVLPEDLEQMYTRTLGWCVLASLYVRSQIPPGQDLVLDAGSNDVAEHCLQYIEEEIFRDLDPDLAEFVVKCSLYEDIEMDGALAVCGDAVGIKSLMKRLTQSGLPHSQLDGGSTIRLHPLMRQAANRALHKSFNPDEIRKMYGRAFEWQLKRGFIVDAIEACIKSGDWQRCLVNIDSHWLEFVASNGLAKLTDWLSSFPAEARSDPRFIDIKSRVMSQTGESRSLIAYLRPHLKTIAAGFDGHRIMGLWIRYYWALINTESAISYHEVNKELQALVGGLKDPLPMDLAGIEVVLSVAAYMDHELEEGVYHAKKALELVGTNSPEYRARLQDNLAVLEHTKGNSGEAVRLLESSLELCMTSGSYHGVPLKMFNLGWICCMVGQIRKAHELINNGRRVMNRYGIKDVYTLMYADRYEGAILWYLGRRDVGLELLRNSLRLAAEHNPRQQFEMATVLDYYSFLTGYSSSAGNGGTLSGVTSTRETRLSYQAAEAIKHAVALRTKEAEACAKEMYELASEKKVIPWQIHAEFLMAYTSYLCGRVAEGLKHLRCGLELLRQIDWWSYPMANSLLSSFAYVKAIRYNVLPDVAGRLVDGEFRIDLNEAFREEFDSHDLSYEEAGRLLEQAGARQIDSLSQLAEKYIDVPEKRLSEAAQRYLEAKKLKRPRALDIFTLGQCEIARHGIPVKFKRKKSRALFLWLLTVKPQSLHREVVMEYFWPEADPGKSMSSLRTTVKDLRKDLDGYQDLPADSYIRFEHDHFSLCLPEGSAVDVDLFREHLARAKALAARKDRKFDSEFETALYAALELFHGPYLPHDLFEEFAVEFREIVLNQFLSASALLCKHLGKEERFNEIIQVVTRALRFDKLWADGIQILMQTYLSMGRSADAMRAYRDYERVLATELQVRPDPVLAQMFERITL